MSGRARTSPFPETLMPVGLGSVVTTTRSVPADAQPPSVGAATASVRASREDQDETRVIEKLLE
jgi:hypothetical protein